MKVHSLVPAGPDVVKPVTYVADLVEPPGPVVSVSVGVPVEDAAEPTMIQLWFFHLQCILLSHNDKLA